MNELVGETSVAGGTPTALRGRVPSVTGGFTPTQSSGRATPEMTAMQRHLKERHRAGYAESASAGSRECPPGTFLPPSRWKRLRAPA